MKHTHYYSFTVEEVLTSGTNAKMNPPLRTKKDREAIIKRTKRWNNRCHNNRPCTTLRREKTKRPKPKAPNGIIGFETALAATITNLVDKQKISYLDMVRLMSYGPSNSVKTEKGQIKRRTDADITIFDPEIPICIYKGKHSIKIKKIHHL